MPRTPTTPKLTPAVQAHVLSLMGAGLTAVEVAKVTGLHPQTVRKFVKSDPKHAEVIIRVRETTKIASSEALQRLNPKLWDRLDGALKDGAAKDVDALSRAALNLEKVGASVSGENRDVPGDKVQIEVVF